MWAYLISPGVQRARSQILNCLLRQICREEKKINNWVLPFDYTLWNQQPPRHPKHSLDLAKPLHVCERRNVTIASGRAWSSSLLVQGRIS